MNYIILDLEATCWQGNDMDRRQEIIELAAYHINGFGDLKKHFQSFVRPTDHPRLSSYCINLTGIRQNQVDKARRFEVFIHAFQDWLESIDDPQLICTWGAKDLPLIHAECRRHHLDFDFLPPCIDLKSQYTSIHRLSKEPGLIKALEYSGFEFEGDQHRALDDAYNTTKIFLRFLDRWQY